MKGDSSSVLTQNNKRIELHIKRRDKSTFMLVCISGQHDQASPITERSHQSDNAKNVEIKASKLQGPFHSLEQAQGSANAIINALNRDGFLLENAYTLWEMYAQSLCNKSKQLNLKTSGDYAFDPKDVY